MISSKFSVLGLWQHKVILILDFKSKIVTLNFHLF